MKEEIRYVVQVSYRNGTVVEVAAEPFRDDATRIAADYLDRAGVEKAQIVEKRLLAG